MATGKPAEVRRHRGDRRQQDALARFGQHQRVGEVVDVLGRAGEMHELELGSGGARRRELLAHEVLDRLDVVVGLALNRLDAGEPGLIHATGEGFEARRHRRGGAGERREAAGAGQPCEPRGLNAHAAGDQGGLAEERRKVGAFVGIASVEGRQRVQAGVGHGARARMIECASYP